MLQAMKINGSTVPDSDSRVLALADLDRVPVIESFVHVDAKARAGEGRAPRGVQRRANAGR
jgi:hypothetical protein